jgi:hypothetical protein
VKSLVYVLTRRLTERWLFHAVVHKGTCWHIEGAMARGEVTALSDHFARATKMPRCQDCRP